MKLATILVAALLAASPAAAQYGPPVPEQPQGPDVAWFSAQRDYFASLKPEDGWEKTPEGLYWRRVDGTGAGPHPDLSSMVTVHYAGALIDGTVFDSSAERGPASFQLAGLVPAWQIAIPLMARGDTIEIAVPSSLGYGMRGAGPIPPGATLLFTIRLLDFQPG